MLTCFHLLIIVFPFLAPTANAQFSSDIHHLEGVVDLDENPIHTAPRNSAYKRIGHVDEYLIGPGDLLKISVYDGSTAVESNVRILPDSTVSMAVISRIKVGGLTISEATDALLDELSLYIRTPSVQVTVEEYTSKTASVFGAIDMRSVSISGKSSGPGSYPITGRMTVLDLVFEAGGPSPDARLNPVSITRGGRTYLLDLLKATRSGDDSHNIAIEHGDIIRVSATQQADSRIAVLGEVYSPGVHNLSSQATILEAIANTNGFTEDASANRIRIIRRTDPQNPVVLTVNALRLLNGDLSQNVGLEDGDIVVVPRD